jgi:transposase
VFGSISGLRYARESFIAAKVENRILAPFCYQGTCNTDLFNMWLKEFLIPELKQGQVIILDNASFHKSKESEYLLESVGCKILFLPAYSPDLNPIEIFWANFKKMVQVNLEKLKTLAKAIDFSFLTALRIEKNQI